MLPIVVRSPAGDQILYPSTFEKESDLEKVLCACPELLRPQNAPRVVFVGRQVDLREAGVLDSLFVSDQGTPIAVEVKLVRNAQARREVVAQAIDYLSALMTLTVDELDERLGGSLGAALQTIANGDQAAFERLWQTVGTNLRAGLGRLVVVMDDAPEGLERIFRFLARSSELQVQLVTVQRYLAPVAGEVFVPRLVVDSAAEDKIPAERSVNVAGAEVLQAVVELYNATAPTELQTRGAAQLYRIIRLPGWGAGINAHYEFMLQRNDICVDFHIESDVAKPLATTLMPFDGTAIAEGKAILRWDGRRWGGRGRLTSQFPLSTSPHIIAAAMQDLIALTRKELDAKLPDLSP